MGHVLRTIERAGNWIGRAPGPLVTAPVRRAAALVDGVVNLATVASLALLILAQPAFLSTAGQDWLRQLDLSVTFLDRDGKEIGRRGIRHDDRVELRDMPPHLIAAVLATEDRRFFSHWGIDPIGLGRALLANARADGIVQGGSTLTQQLAKNLFLTGERTLERKIREAFLAVWLEFRLSKAEILKLYLDRAYMGAGAFGIEAAAAVYFGKSVRDVTLPEAAILAGLFKAPSRYGPHLGAADARAADVLDRMYEAGAIDRAERDAARRAPATAISREGLPHPGFYLDWAFREVQRLAAAGRFGRDTALVVETPLDSALQDRAESALEAALARDGGRVGADQAALVVMEPGGAVRAMVGGRDYGASQFNRAVDARRQPGSSFKPFVYAAALAHTALRPGSVVTDAEICLERWCPANYGRTFSGEMSLTAALARSINTVAVRLSVEIGRQAGEMSIGQQARFGRARIIELARELGVATPLQDTPSLPLGASEVTLLDMSAGYAAFASGGVRAEPHAVTAVRTPRGTPLYRRRAGEPRRVLASDIAGEMNAMLAKVVEAGTGRRAAIAGHPTAGKTGTTSAYRDAWFAGFTGHLVATVWFGNDDDRPTRELTGGTLPAATWQKVMSFAHRSLAPLPLPGIGGAKVAERRTFGAFQEVASGSLSAGGRGFQVVTGSRGFIVEGR